MFPLRKSRAVISLVLLPLFAFSFPTLPSPAEAATLSAPVPAGFSHNMLERQLEEQAVPQGVIQIRKRSHEVITKCVLDAGNTNRIYLLSETSHGQTLTLKYIYDDALYTVTLLLSQVPEGQTPLFTQYYRYALGPNDSLEMILEEGWTKGNTLNPSRIYDYFAGVVKVRSFDRTGKLLRIESSEGLKRLLVYSRKGRLLTIQDVGADGEISFFDQIAAGVRNWALPQMDLSENTLYALPGRNKEKHFANTGRSRGSSGLSDPLFRGDNGQIQNTYFLLWLESAHPLRAGPAGGLL